MYNYDDLNFVVVIVTEARKLSEYSKMSNYALTGESFPPQLTINIFNAQRNLSYTGQYADVDCPCTWGFVGSQRICSSCLRGKNFPTDSLTESIKGARKDSRRLQ